MAFSPCSQVADLIAIVGSAISTFFVEGLAGSVPSFIPFLLVITSFYWMLTRPRRAI